MIYIPNVGNRYHNNEELRWASVWSEDRKQFYCSSYSPLSLESLLKYTFISAKSFLMQITLPKYVCSRIIYFTIPNCVSKFQGGSRDPRSLTHSLIWKLVRADWLPLKTVSKSNCRHESLCNISLGEAWQSCSRPLLFFFWEGGGEEFSYSSYDLLHRWKM